MDMYQKRKMRQEKKNNDSPKSFPSVGRNSCRKNAKPNEY